jgi:hypothetical protein
MDGGLTVGNRRYSGRCRSARGFTRSIRCFLDGDLLQRSHGGFVMLRHPYVVLPATSIRPAAPEYSNDKRRVMREFPPKARPSLDKCYRARTGCIHQPQQGAHARAVPQRLLPVSQNEIVRIALIYRWLEEQGVQDMNVVCMVLHYGPDARV